MFVHTVGKLSIRLDYNITIISVTVVVCALCCLPITLLLHLCLSYLSTPRQFILFLPSIYSATKARSPVFSHTNSTLQGLATIRASNAQHILIQEFDRHQDLNTSAWYLCLATIRAFAFWLELVCVLYTAAVTFSFLVLGNGELQWICT